LKRLGNGTSLPAPEKAATVATTATRDRGNVAAVAAVAPSQEEDAGFEI